MAEMTRIAGSSAAAARWCRHRRRSRRGGDRPADDRGARGGRMAGRGGRTLKGYLPTRSGQPAAAEW
jgi:hypothetical protein